MMQANQLIATTAFMFGVEQRDLFSANRTARVAEARQALAWALRQSNWSLEAIGDFLRRDHTTIIYALKAVEAKARHNPRFAERLSALAQPVDPPIDLQARVTELEQRVAQLERLLAERN